MKLQVLRVKPRASEGEWREIRLAQTYKVIKLILPDGRALWVGWRETDLHPHWVLRAEVGGEQGKLYVTTDQEREVATDSAEIKVFKE